MFVTIDENIAFFRMLKSNFAENWRNSMQKESSFPPRSARQKRADHTKILKGISAFCTIYLVGLVWWNTSQVEPIAASKPNKTNQKTEQVVNQRPTPSSSPVTKQSEKSTPIQSQEVTPTPSQSPKLTPVANKEITTVESKQDIPKWNSSKTYQPGDRVLYQNKIFEAKGWIKGITPKLSNVVGISPWILIQ